MIQRAERTLFSFPRPLPPPFSRLTSIQLSHLFPLLYETQTKNTSEYRLLRRVHVIGMEMTAKKCDALVDMLLCLLNQLILAISLLKLSTVKFLLTRNLILETGKTGQVFSFKGNTCQCNCC